VIADYTPAKREEVFPYISQSFIVKKIARIYSNTSKLTVFLLFLDETPLNE